MKTKSIVISSVVCSGILICIITMFCNALKTPPPPPPKINGKVFVDFKNSILQRCISIKSQSSTWRDDDNIINGNRVDAIYSEVSADGKKTPEKVLKLYDAFDEYLDSVTEDSKNLCEIIQKGFFKYGINGMDIKNIFESSKNRGSLVQNIESMYKFIKSAYDSLDKKDNLNDEMISGMESKKKLIVDEKEKKGFMISFPKINAEIIEDRPKVELVNSLYEKLQKENELEGKTSILKLKSAEDKLNNTFDQKEMQTPGKGNGFEILKLLNEYTICIEAALYDENNKTYLDALENKMYSAFCAIQIFYGWCDRMMFFEGYVMEKNSELTKKKIGHWIYKEEVVESYFKSNILPKIKIKQQR